MAEFNKYALYTMGGMVNNMPKEDTVDKCVNELRRLDEYDDVLKFVTEHFGDINGDKMIEYPDINKQIYVVVDEKKIEVHAAKNMTQFFGNSWILVGNN